MASSPPAPQSHQALYRRWRAQTFEQIVGQTAVVETLRNAVRLGRLSHGFLFVGPRGTGKTSMARILAKAVNCTELRDGEPCDACPSCVSIREGRALDVVELDAASNNRVDDMRELLPRVYTSASDLRRKVFIIDEVQRIKEGWDVLLKTLEEPPDNVLFVFCTTNAAQIRPAVVSRLQRFQFRPLTVDQIVGKLAMILRADGLAADDEAIALIASLAAGGMRDAESMLDQVLSSADGTLDAGTVRDLLGLAELSEVDAFIGALATGVALPGIEVLDRLESTGRDLVAFADQVVARLRQQIVDGLMRRPSEEGSPQRASPADLARAARRLTGLDANRSTAASFRFQLELALFQEAHPDPSAGIAASPSRVAPTAVDASAVTPMSSTPEAPRSQRPRPTARVPSIPAGAAGVPGGGDAALEELRTAWPDLVAWVSRNPAYRPLIDVCRPVEVRDGIVVLGFPEDKAFLRDRAESKKSVFEDALRQVLGRPMGVRCVATNVDALEPRPDSASLDIMEQARRIFGGDVVDVAEVD